jgi:hypothetical protein
MTKKIRNISRKKIIKIWVEMKDNYI